MVVMCIVKKNPPLSSHFARLQVTFTLIMQCCFVIASISAPVVSATTATITNHMNVLQDMYLANKGEAIDFVEMNSCLQSYNQEHLKGIPWDFSTDADGDYINDACNNSTQNSKFAGIACDCSIVTGVCDIIQLNPICGNFVGTLPHSIGNLVKLQSLDLKSNHMTGTRDCFCFLFR